MQLRTPTGIVNRGAFRDRAASWLTRRTFTLAVILITTGLMAAFGAAGYLAGLAVALLILWATRWDLARFGFGIAPWRSQFVRTLRQAIAWVLFSILAVDVLLLPLAERLTGEPPDFSRFAFLEGSLVNLVLFTLFMWVAAAFGEEFFYRGYVMKQLAELLGGSRPAWLAAIVLSAVPFGIVHLYQGWSGVVSAGAMGVVLGTAFYLNRRNLAVCVLAHGLYDMVGLTLIYLGRADVLQRFRGG